MQKVPKQHFDLLKLNNSLIKTYLFTKIWSTHLWKEYYLLHLTRLIGNKLVSLFMLRTQIIVTQHINGEKILLRNLVCPSQNHIIWFVCEGGGAKHTIPIHDDNKSSNGLILCVTVCTDIIKYYDNLTFVRNSWQAVSVEPSWTSVQTRQSRFICVNQLNAIFKYFPVFLFLYFTPVWI